MRVLQPNWMWDPDRTTQKAWRGSTGDHRRDLQGRLGALLWTI